MVLNPSIVTLRIYSFLDLSSPLENRNNENAYLTELLGELTRQKMAHSSQHLASNAMAPFLLWTRTEYTNPLLYESLLTSL